MDALEVPSKKAVAKAGSTLIDPAATDEQYHEAMQVLSQWRGLHRYPVNTFQANLRKKCKDFDLKDITIAQRLKRTPSIVRKLKRFPEMNLARMQDIGGLRVVLPSMKDVKRLHEYYLQAERLKHEAILPPKDYIGEPKADGYRSLHQVFKYKNAQRPELDGLRVELQIRTKIQHAWATAVETLGLLERASFKTGDGSEEYRRFFLLCSAMFALKEKTPLPLAIQHMPAEAIRTEIKSHIINLQILDKLKGVAVAAKHIEAASVGKAAYHVMILDVENHKTSLVPFTDAQFDLAKDFYLAQEQALKTNAADVVLISVGDVKEVKKAYPNYFLDTQQFIKEIEKIISG